MKTESIGKYFPIQEIAENCLINGNGDLTAGWGLNLPEVSTLSVEDYNRLHEDLCKILKGLPIGAEFHFQGFYHRDIFSADLEKSNLIMKEDLRMFHLRPVFRSYANCYVTFSNEVGGKPDYSNSPIVRGFNWAFKKPFKGIQKLVEQFKLACNSFQGDLNSSLIKAKRLGNEELRAALYDYFTLNYSSPCQADKAKDMNLEDIYYEPGVLRVGDKYVSVISLTTEGSFLKTSLEGVKIPQGITDLRAPSVMESAVSMGFVGGLGIPFDHIYNVSIRTMDKTSIMESLNGISQIVERNVLSNFDSEAQNKIHEINNFEKAIGALNYTPCLVKMNVIIHDSNLPDLQAKAETVKKVFRDMNDSKLYVENIEVANLFFASCPGGIKFNYRQPMVETIDQAVCYIPKESQYKSDKEGIIFTSLYGEPFVINFWNSPYIVNRNFVGFGPSGTGKSFTINHILNQLRNQGNTLFIIDKGGSYKRLVSFLGGVYIDSGERSSLSFNVFLECPKDNTGRFLYDQKDEDGTGAEDIINYIYSVLKMIWKGSTAISNEERTILKDSIAKYYDYVNANKVHPDLDGYFDYTSVYENEIIKGNRKMFFNFDSFRLLLEEYAKGAKKALLNSKRPYGLKDVDVVCFDLEAIKNDEQLTNVVSAIVLGIAVNKVENSPIWVRKDIIVDEAIDFLKSSEDMADFISDCYRKVRKRNGQIGILTQGVKYLNDLPALVRASILGNCDIKILLSHDRDADSLPALQQTLSLTEHDMKLLSMVRPRKHAFIKMGNYAKVVNIEVSDFSQGVYTTNPDEIGEIDKLFNKYGNLELAIKEWNYNKYAQRKLQTA